MDNNKYTHIGVIFEKKIVNDHIVLNPVSTARCNIVDELTYDVEFIGEIGSIFENSFDLEDQTMGFVISIDDLKLKYGDLEEGIKIYQYEIFKYLYIQKYNSENDSVVTYKLDLYDNIFKKIAEFKDNAIDYKDEEITFTNDKFLNTSKLKKTTIDKTENKEKTNIKIDMIELYKYIKESVIGQDKAIRQIVSTIDRNYNLTNYRNKTNILLIGPSGAGKTEIFRTIEEKLNIPITIEDSEQYSAVGYQGSSISDMLIKLYHKANDNLELAERGILVIDEIDKKVSNTKDDVSGNRVLNSLLSLMEGTTFRINTTENDFNPNYVNFDTSYLTVILAGAFSDMTEEEKGLGFNSDIRKNISYQEIDLKKLNKYGLSREILRRVSIYKLNELSIDDLINIMNNSKNSALKEFYDYAKKKKIKLYIDDQAIKKIAYMAKEKNIGASGIKATLNEILNDAFFEYEANKDIYSSIKITETSLSKNPPYILIKKK